jgi:hypothetical protein
VAWRANSIAVQLAVPLLAGCAICLPDEKARLVAYGVVAAIAFCAALFEMKTLTFADAACFVVAGTALLRWIAREQFQFVKELIVLALAIAIIAIGRHTRLSIAIALAAVLYTPAIPARTLLIPFAFMLLAAALRQLKLDIPALAAIALMLTLFPFSGIVARTPRYLWRGKPALDRINLYRAMKPGEVEVLDVPHDAHFLILSLSNGATLKRMKNIGTLGDRELHAGDVVDWGFARRAEWWRSTTRLPRHTAGLIRAYGYDGWVDGAVRFELPQGAKTIRIAVDPKLPPKTMLQVEAFER